MKIQYLLSEKDCQSGNAPKKIYQFDERNSNNMQHLSHQSIFQKLLCDCKRLIANPMTHIHWFSRNQSCFFCFCVFVFLKIKRKEEGSLYCVMKENRKEQKERRGCIMNEWKKRNFVFFCFVVCCLFFVLVFCF